MYDNKIWKYAYSGCSLSENQHFRCAAHILYLSVPDILNVLKIDDAVNQNEKNFRDHACDEENDDYRDIRESKGIKKINTKSTTSLLLELKGFFHSDLFKCMSS